MGRAAMSDQQQTERFQHRFPQSWEETVPIPAQISSTLEASRMLDEVRDALDHDLTAACAGVDRLAAYLKILAGRAHAPLPARGGLAPWQEHKVRAYIEEHLGARISVEILADLVSLSESHFCRAFKESFGETPHAHIVRQRVGQARRLMLTTAEPLSHIALKCGFADQAHLTKSFRRAVGETPSAWRRVNTHFL
jgi:AraC-like DNA-binding protein